MIYRKGDKQMKINPELATFKYHPRIMELKLSMVKQLLVRQYGEEIAMTLLQALAQMFECNWTILVGVLNKDYKITYHPVVSNKRRKQEVIFMGALYGETRYKISEQYLNMSANYLYQSKQSFNPESFADNEWLSQLNNEVVVCGAKAYATEVKRFLVAFEAFFGIFK